MKITRYLILLLTLCAPGVFAGTATLFTEIQGNPSSAASGVVTFNRYSTSSLTITVSAYASAGSQQGGGRNYHGAAEAAIGDLIQRDEVRNGSDPMSVSAVQRMTLTKGGDGRWYADGKDMGESVTVSALAYVDGENAQGFATVSADVTWMEGPGNQAPTIRWSSAPATTGHQQRFLIGAEATDEDGNLAQVYVWKNGVPFAFSGGGNGYSGASGNGATESGPQSVTFTAQAVDALGAASPLISHTVSVAAEANLAPSAFLLEPGSQTLTVGTTLTLRTRATDADGGLLNHNLDILRPAGDWNFEGGFAAGEPYQGGPIGSASESLRSANFTFTDVGAYTIRASANDGFGWVHSNEVVIVVVAAPVTNQPPQIAWDAVPASAGDGERYQIRARATDADGNLTQVNVWKNGVPFAFAGGGDGYTGDSDNASADAGPQTITFTAQAVDALGLVSPIITHSVVIGGPNLAPQIRWLNAPASAASGAPYQISVRAEDPDGNLAQVNVWKNGVPFAFAGGGDGFSGESGNGSNDPGPQTITFTAQAVDAAGLASATLSHTVVIGSPNQPPQIRWQSAPASAVHNEAYLVSVRAEDPDGNLTQVNIWKNGAPFAFAGGGDGFAGDSENRSTDTGPQTVVYTAQAVDATGASSPLVSHGVVIGSPPVQFFALTTRAGEGGAVSPGGSFPSGALARATATADGSHDFVGWSGDASGNANPLDVLVDRDLSVRAQFTLKAYALVTSASGGGRVTAGGSYLHGTTVAISASADVGSRFVGWRGDASGTEPVISLTLTGPATVLALFDSKLPQVITFPAVADTYVSAGTIPLMASASSGLQVTYSIVTGPAAAEGNLLRITGPGHVTVQAEQAGDDWYLPAPPLQRDFNIIAPGVVRYRGAARTRLLEAAMAGTAPFVLGNP